MLSTESLQQIDRAIKKYPEERKQSAVMAALAIAQREHGWLSNELMKAVADYLEMPPIAVYEVASFYTMYNLNPGGRFKLAICTNLPCALQGANHTVAALKCRLGVDWNETTSDGLFTLKESECMGACGDAPVIIVNNQRMVSKVMPERIDTFLDGLKNEKEAV